MQVHTRSAPTAARVSAASPRARAPARAGVAFSYAGTEGVDRGNALKITKEISAYDSDSKARTRAPAVGRGLLPACMHLSGRASLT